MIRSYVVIAAGIALGSLLSGYSYAGENGGQNISANRFVLGTAIKNREPVNIKTEFSVADGKIYAFADLQASTDSKVVFVWSYNGNNYLTWSGQVTSSSNFRTYSFVTPRKGQWSVKLQDGNGNLLGEKTFSVNDANSVQSDILADNSKETTAEDAKPAQPKNVKEALKSLQPESVNNKDGDRDVKVNTEENNK